MAVEKKVNSVDKRFTVIVYVPCKGYMVDLPARDMSLEEWESFPEDLREAALKQGLYLVHKTKKEVENA